MCFHIFLILCCVYLCCVLHIHNINTHEVYNQSKDLTGEIFYLTVPPCIHICAAVCIYDVSMYVVCMYVVCMHGVYINVVSMYVVCIWFQLFLMFMLLHSRHCLIEIFIHYKFTTIYSKALPLYYLAMFFI